MRVAAYARYSTDKQSGNSIAYQKQAIEKYCAEHDIIISCFFVDEAETGTNTDRPGFRALVSAVERGAVDTVLIYDISRGARDVGDWFQFRRSMQLLGVKLISVTQNLGDLTDPTEFFHELITVGVGQFEVLQTRQKSIAGVAARAKEGVFLGGVPPLGYDIVDGEYTINDQEADSVRRIFDMYANGHSYGDILRAIKGTRGKRGRPLGKNSLHSILKNERYIGIYTWNKRKVKTLGRWAGGVANPSCVRIEGRIPPIIDITTWERVRERMDARVNGQNSAKRRTYLLSGLIECEACGAKYIGKTNTNSRGYQTSYYVCGNKHRTKTCKAKNINASELETYVVDSLVSYLRTIDFTAEAVRIADAINNSSVDLRKEKAEIVQIETQLANGVKAILSGLVFPELQDEMDRLRIRKSELEEIIRRADIKTTAVEPSAVVEILEEAIASIQAGQAQTAVRYLVAKIIAHIDGTITVNVGVTLDGCGSPQHAIVTTIQQPVC